MVFRLECLTEDHDPPSPSLVHVEHILVDLATDPAAILSRDLSKCILSLRPPLSYITEDERLTMRKVALVADHGLPLAIEEISAFASQPMDIRNLRILRVSLAVIEQELHDEITGEWRVYRALWNEKKHGLVSRLVDIFAAVGDDLQGNFLCTPPPTMSEKHVQQLFQTATDVLRLIVALCHAYPPMSRAIRILTNAIADVFACADVVDTLWSHSSALCIVAVGSRQACVDLVHGLSTSQISSEPGESMSEIVFRTLLEHGARGARRDPIRHLLQVHCLIDHLLPVSTAEGTQKHYWVTSIFPAVLPEMWSFFRVLDTQNKVQFIKRLVILDCGVVGIGEWLLSEELKRLHYVLQSPNDIEQQVHSVGQYEALLSLRFLFELVTTTCLSAWCMTTLGDLPDVAQTLAQCLMSFLDAYLSSPELSQLTQSLASGCATFDPILKFVLALILLRMARDSETANSSSDLMSISLHIFRDLSKDNLDMNQLQLEIGRTLSGILSSDYIVNGLDAETAETILFLLEWFSEVSLPDATFLRGITVPSFAKLCDCIQSVLPPGRTDTLESLQPQVTVDGENFISRSTYLAESIQLSIQDLENLLYPPASMPSTPKRNTPDLLSLVTISPPTAVLRSPAATGLTKTYSNNDFRQLRQLPSARQNTSRLPSMHVDVGINGGLA